MKKVRLFVPDYGVFAEKDVHRRHIVVGERAEAEGIATVECAPRASVEELSLVHTPEYVEALRSGEPYELASTGGDWFPGFLEISLSALGNYLGALDAALADGIAGVAAGGGHHAFPDHGGALCPINDAVRDMDADGVVKPVLGCRNQRKHVDDGLMTCLIKD